MQAREFAQRQFWGTPSHELEAPRELRNCSRRYSMLFMLGNATCSGTVLQREEDAPELVRRPEDFHLYRLQSEVLKPLYYDGSSLIQKR